MSDFKNIVCATDLSGPSDEAVAQASALAQRSGGTLTLLHVFGSSYPAALTVPAPPLSPLLQADDLRQQIGDAISAQLGRVAKGAKASIEIRLGVEMPPEVVVEFADSHGADLVVVGSRGATGLKRLALGSVAESVTRHAACPVLIARPSPPQGPILAATDLSDPSRAAIGTANAEALRRGAKLTVLRCMDFPPPMMAFGYAPAIPLPSQDPHSRVALTQQADAEVREALARLGVRADVLIEQGRPQTAIPHLAEELSAALVVVGTRGRTGLKRLVLGSVAESVVRHAPCSVLAVRQTPAGASARA